MRGLTIGRFALALLAAVTSGASAGRRPAAPIRSVPTVAALPLRIVGAHGATLPFYELEAETAATNGATIGPSRRFGQIAAEASGRRAVRLDRDGQYIAFVLPRPTNALTVRLAIPDTADGSGRDATLSVLVAGRRVGRLSATSRYGWFYGRYPFSNRPADGAAHHFFDETRLRLPRTLPAGTVIRIVKTAADRAPWYVVDLIDGEMVPPAMTRPAGSLSVTDFGADPHASRSSSAAFDAGIAAARRSARTLWIPPGRYRIDRHIIVDRVRILGAGPWYSSLEGDGIGFYGKPAPEGSTNVELGGFAIVGRVTDRVDDAQRNAIGGAMGGDSYLHDLFIQHHKVGLWFDGPMDGLRLRRLRVVDCTADGLNFHRGVSNARVEDSFFRNTGDDGIAAWSEHDADHDIVIAHNTVIAPILANGIAIYGGHDIRVTGNLVADTVTEGGGLHLGNRFGAVPVSGPISMAGNLVVRGGSVDPHWHFGVGALWFYALDAPIRADVAVSGTMLLDSTREAIQFIGKRIETVAFDDLTIDRVHAPVFSLRSAGHATLRGVTLRHVRYPFESGGAGFVITRAGRPSSGAIGD